MFKSLFLIFSLTVVAHTHAEPMPLAFSPECTFMAVASKMGAQVNFAIPFPAVHVKSESVLADFQEAVFSQYGFKLDNVTNVYVPTRNTIFLNDDLEVYTTVNRFVDDALAHELVHYIQFMYHGKVNGGGSDLLERQATRIQTWYRETFMQTGLSPCH